MLKIAKLLKQRRRPFILRLVGTT